MLGSLSYDELLNLAKSISTSSENIRSIASKYGETLGDVINFCNSLESYSKFIESNVALNKDADFTLQFMINKNK